MCLQEHEVTLTAWETRAQQAECALTNAKAELGIAVRKRETAESAAKELRLEVYAIEFMQ